MWIWMWQKCCFRNLQSGALQVLFSGFLLKPKLYHFWCTSSLPRNGKELTLSEHNQEIENRAADMVFPQLFWRMCQYNEHRAYFSFRLLFEIFFSFKFTKRPRPNHSSSKRGKVYRNVVPPKLFIEYYQRIFWFTVNERLYRFSSSFSENWYATNSQGN